MRQIIARQGSGLQVSEGAEFDVVADCQMGILFGIAIERTVSKLSRMELPVAGDDFAVLNAQVGNLGRQLQFVTVFG